MGVSSCSMLFPTSTHPARRSPFFFSICICIHTKVKENRVHTDSEQRPRWNVVLASITGKRPSPPVLKQLSQPVAATIMANSMLLLDIFQPSKSPVYRIAMMIAVKKSGEENFYSNLWLLYSLTVAFFVVIFSSACKKEGSSSPI